MIDPKDVECIDVDGSDWNCDKCLFFVDADCSCKAMQRLLFAQAIHDDCDDCKRPFVYKKTDL